MEGNKGPFDRLLFLYKSTTSARNNKKYRTINYPNSSFVIRSLTSTDADFTVGLQFKEFHRITQEDLNYLIRDLGLLKNKSELMFQDGNNATF